MQQTQSIIVYRNPMEQQFWEGASNSPGILLFILIMMVVSVAIIALFLGPILNSINRRKGNSGFQYRNRNIRTKDKNVTIMWSISLLIIAVIGYNLRFLLN